MDQLESKMDEYPNLSFRFMPFPFDKHGGVIIDNNIFINSNLSKEQQYQDLNEEIAHYETTVGDIVKEDTLDKRQQEHLARSRAMETVVSLDGLIHCFNHEIWTDQEVSDYFGVEVVYLHESLEHWKEKFGVVFRYKNYWIDLSRGINISRI
ncbi:ImmA/IrrE family metallo-endopeptidase [Pediococcus argentinicus]|uniref:ImmA/IrrE family metallo-endopeptidase n=1 Tax=Pediococcus argentinicus TaxID=480391 RepID=UPI00339011FC